MTSRIGYPLFIAAACLTLAGCSFHQAALEHAETESDANAAQLTEESRALTTGVVDALALAPTNPPTHVALELAQRDQQIVGAPTHRIDTAALVRNNAAAWQSLRARFDHQEALLDERNRLQTQLDAAYARLVEMGRLYEQEHNRSIIRRVWAWAIGTLGIGGLVALCIFCPAIVPILGSLLGWLVGKVPKLASYFGLVSKKAFDAVVKGVGEARWKLDHSKNDSNQAALSVLDTELSKATEIATQSRPLIDARRTALNV